MKLRPTIFLSGVTSEFASFREAVAQEILRKGCYPLNQPTFDVDYREIETILREKLSEADAVVHLVGFRFGDEPKGRPADKPRRSYTQLEFDVARELEKPVYLFLSSDATVRDSEDELQLAHRQAIQNGNDQFHYFKDKEELCKLVAGIKHVAQTDFRVDISRIDKYAPAELIGRENELALLNDAWLKVRRDESSRPHILTFVALGGEGKTSLVAKWLANLAFQNWPGCDSAFAWSFYSQGTREQYAASSDLFLKEAITFFGDNADKELAASAASAYEKGQRLARIIAQRRALLILDGLEPLQYAPTSPTAGELKDGSITALLKGLAARSHGLCIVTTRYSIPNLKAFWQTTTPEISLTRLSQAAGVHLLKTLGVKGSVKEFEALVEDVKGHALTLNLFGTYLRDAHAGDIRRRDVVKLEEAVEEQGGHAFRVMKAYERLFAKEGDRGKQALAILRLLALFDRPTTADCLNALLEEPSIVGLTDNLVGLSPTLRNLVFQRLQNTKLITVNREPSSALISVDAHPLVRDYFAKDLRTKQPNAWRVAHKRLYGHLCSTTPDKEEPTLEELQPLYQAVAHGCQAGMHESAFIEVYIARILRGTHVGGNYSAFKLGAVGSDLAAVSWFFSEHWSRVDHVLKESEAFLLNNAAVYLLWSGRLNEAREPFLKSFQICLGRSDWHGAALRASNLSELEVKLGNLEAGVKYGKEAVTLAEKTTIPLELVIDSATLGDALHQHGFREEALVYFKQALEIAPVMISFRGFRHRDFLLAEAERVAWLCFLNKEALLNRDNITHALAVCRNVELQAANSYKAAAIHSWLLEVSLDRLILAQTALYWAVLTPSSPNNERDLASAAEQISSAIHGLHAAGHRDELPRGLLSRAWVRCLTGARTCPDSAEADLDEAWEIAERGPMRLFMADIHLYRARLFFREEEYPWESAEADLAAARKLIEHCGYWRRKEELEDAERVILK